jgi:hypothetical protein
MVFGDVLAVFDVALRAAQAVQEVCEKVTDNQAEADVLGANWRALEESLVNARSGGKISERHHRPLERLKNLAEETKEFLRAFEPKAEPTTKAAQLAARLTKARNCKSDGKRFDALNRDLDQACKALNLDLVIDIDLMVFAHGENLEIVMGKVDAIPEVRAEVREVKQLLFNLRDDYAAEARRAAAAGWE